MSSMPRVLCSVHSCVTVCGLPPAYMMRSHSPSAVTAGPWPRVNFKAASGHQCLSEQLPEWLYPPLNRPSGSDCRGQQGKKKMGNAAKKEVRAEGQLFFFQPIFLDRVFGRSRTIPEVDFLKLCLFVPGEAIRL